MEINEITNLKLLDIKQEVEKINGFFNSNFLSEFEKEKYLPDYPKVTTNFYDHYKTYSKELIDLFNNNYNKKIYNSTNGKISFNKELVINEIVVFSNELNQNIITLNIGGLKYINLIPCNKKTEHFEKFTNNTFFVSKFETIDNNIKIKNKFGDIIDIKYDIIENKINIKAQTNETEEYFLYYNPYRNAYINKEVFEGILFINSSDGKDFSIKVR